MRIDTTIRALAIGVAGLLLGQEGLGAQEPATPCGEATEPNWLCYGDHANCSIDATTDIDQLKFPGKAGDIVRIVVSTSTVCLDPKIEVRDPMNQILHVNSCSAFCDAFTSSTCAFGSVITLATSGPHTIFLSDLGLDETGGVTVTLEKIVPDTPEPFLDYNSTQVVNIGHRGDADYLRFVAEAGSDVLFTVDGQTNCLDPSIHVFDESGNQIVSSSCSAFCDAFTSTSCSLSFEIGAPNEQVIVFPYTGTYYLRVQDSGADETGNVAVTMNCLFAASGTCPSPPIIGPTGTSYCTAQLNSSGNPASLLVIGSPTIADDDLHLLVSDGPPAKIGHFLFGPNQGFLPFFAGGQGNLCLSAPIGRFPQSQLCSLGAAHLALDLPNLAQGFMAQPGDTWNFQMWFRDSNGGSTTNLSDAVAVDFL